MVAGRIGGPGASAVQRAAVDRKRADATVPTRFQPMVAFPAQATILRSSPVTIMDVQVKKLQFYLPNILFSSLSIFIRMLMV